MRVRSRRNYGSGEPVPCLTGTFENLWPNKYTENRVASYIPLYARRSEETILDETHPRQFGKFLSGGPLDLCRYQLQADATPCNLDRWSDGLSIRSMSGVIYPQLWGIPIAIHLGMPASGMDACKQLGAEGWNKFKPGKPKVGTSVFLAELRDLPGMLQKRAYAHRNLGKHYLNAQFGWLPFVSDLRKMYQTYREIDRTLANIYRMNGKWVKREGTLRSEDDILANWKTGGDTPCWNPQPWNDMAPNGNSWCEGQVRTSTRAWFAGRFRYYIPEIDQKIKDPRWRRSTVRKIMGLTITPADVWEAVPWSWLIDYFTNAGDILSNLSSGYVDDVVASYAYVMRSSITEVCQTSHHTLIDGRKIFGQVRSFTETKARAAADPFGFGMSADLTGRQVAILAALGLSRH